MSEKQDQCIETIITMLQVITKQINDNGKATQSQIDEVKTGIYALEARVTQLEGAQKKKVVNQPKPICKNEIEQIVHEVMHERGGVFGRNEFGTVLNKEKVYARCKQRGYTRHQVLTGLRDAEILVTGNDGCSLRLVWDGKNQKPFRAIVVKF